MNNQETNAEVTRPKGRLTFLLILGIVIVPMVLATLMYFNNVLVPSGRTNKGTLILPPLELGRFAMVNSEQKRVTAKDLGEKWALILVGEGPCEDACQQALYHARQVNVALGKEAHRVIRYYVEVGGAIAPEVEQFVKAEYPRLNLASADKYSLKRYLDQRVDSALALEQSYIFVADPMGNIMMYYTPENSGKDILEDLKRLLKVSRIG